MKNITSEELSRFEMELNQFKFHEIPVGSLIGSHLNIDFLYGHFNQKDYLRELATYYYIKYLPGKQIKGFNFKKHLQSKNLPMLTFLSERRHLFNMSYPVFEELGPENVFCLIKDKKVLHQFKNKPVHYSFFNELPKYPYGIWRRDFYRLWLSISEIVNNFIERNNIHKNYKLRLKNNLLSETRYIMAFEKMLGFLQAKYTLTESDRYTYTSALISQANIQKIPTYTMVHGVPGNSIGFTPLVAGKVFVWGQRQKITLMNYGLKESQIAISGAPQLSKEIIGEKETLKAKLGLSNDVIIIVLATNPTRIELRVRLYKLFCDAISHLPTNEYVGFIKLHPSEDISFYKKLNEASPNILFDVNNEISYENTFALADMVCNYNSAFAIDTVLRGLPLVTINIDENNLGQAKDYIDYGKLPQAKTSQELSNLIIDYFNSIDKNLFLSKVKTYAEDYCKYTGQLAAKKLISEIRKDVI
jgi:hypothetical protein